MYYFSHCEALLNDNNFLMVQSKRLQEILSKYFPLLLKSLSLLCQENFISVTFLWSVVSGCISVSHCRSDCFFQRTSLHCHPPLVGTCVSSSTKQVVSPGWRVPENFFFPMNAMSIECRLADEKVVSCCL